MREIVHIYWQGPIDLDELSKFNDTNIDHGIYQVYGNHPVYATNALLYIGMAYDQTFYTRIKQHQYDIDQYNEGKIEIYIGRLTGLKNINNKKWDDLIIRSEKLLITSHKPAWNASNIKEFKDSIDITIQELHILNWGNYAKLLPEVSGDRWSNKWATDLEYKPFTLT